MCFGIVSFFFFATQNFVNLKIHVLDYSDPYVAKEMQNVEINLFCINV